MANPDKPVGFVPVKSMTGAPVTGLTRWYEIADNSSDTTNDHGDIYPGSPVTLSSGKVAPANSGDTILGVAVALGQAANHGSVEGFNPADLTQRYYKHSDSGGWVGVVPAEGVLFRAQTATGVTAANFINGYKCDFTTDANEAHGSRVTGLDSAEIAPPVNNDLEIITHVDSPDNDITLVNADFYVQFIITQHGGIGAE